MNALAVTPRISEFWAVLVLVAVFTGYESENLSYVMGPGPRAQAGASRAHRTPRGERSRLRCHVPSVAKSRVYGAHNPDARKTRAPPNRLESLRQTVRRRGLLSASYNGQTHNTIACPNRRCRRPLVWIPNRLGWQAPIRNDGCVICRTPQAYGLALAAHAQGKSWQEIRRENVS